MRVVTWNLHGAGRPDVVAAARALRALDPDVVALQEVRRPQARTVAEVLRPVSWSWTLKHLRYGPLLPLHAEGHALMLPEAVPVATAVLTPDAPSWTSRRRVVQVADLPRAGVRVINTHLDAHEDRRRAPQARRVAALVPPPPQRCVLLGDLNATVDEAGVFGPLRDAGMRDAWPVGAGADASAFTSPAAAPVQRIDHVLVSGAVGVRRVEVPAGEWERWSDHRPVLAELVLRDVDGAVGPRGWLY